MSTILCICRNCYFLTRLRGFHQFYGHIGKRQLMVEQVLSKHNLICLKLSQLVPQRAMALDCCWITLVFLQRRCEPFFPFLLGILFFYSIHYYITSMKHYIMYPVSLKMEIDLLSKAWLNKCSELLKGFWVGKICYVGISSPIIVY